MNYKNDNILRRWMASQGYSLRYIAQLLVLNESNFSKILSGARNANPIITERILRLTSGAVQPTDMHRIRVRWLKSNKPELNFNPSELPLLRAVLKDEGFDEVVRVEHVGAQNG